MCALPVEFAAAQEMLDEEHADLKLQSGDNDENAYALGSIGGCGVVVSLRPSRARAGGGAGASRPLVAACKR